MGAWRVSGNFSIAGRILGVDTDEESLEFFPRCLGFSERSREHGVQQRGKTSKEEGVEAEAGELPPSVEC